MSISGIGNLGNVPAIKPATAHSHATPHAHHNPEHLMEGNIMLEHLAHEAMKITHFDPTEEKEEPDYDETAHRIHKAHKSQS